MAMSELMIEPHDILYINVSRIGDTLLATPAIRAVANRWPNAKIHALAHPGRETVLHHLPFIHRVGVINKQRARFMGHLSAKHYDLAFVCNFDPPLINYALRVARHVVAFRQPDESLNKRLFASAEHPGNRNAHAVDVQLLLPAALQIPPVEKSLCYRVTDEEIRWAVQFLAERKINQRHPLIGLQIASFPTKAFRDWPVSHFVELCHRVKQVWPGSHFLIFGGSLETPRTLELAAHLGESATHCAGQLSLRETGALMNGLDAYVGVDTGPTHLMGALHRPMLVMYHGYLPGRIAWPLDHPCSISVEHPLADQCGPDESIAAITVDRVWEQLKPLIANAGLVSSPASIGVK
jgi:heptosyltransferase-3